MSNKVKIKCLGKDKHNDCCRNNTLDNTRFCKLHDYMCEYSDNMLNNLSTHVSAYIYIKSD